MEKLQNNPTYKVATQLLKHTKKLIRLLVDFCRLIRLILIYSLYFLSLNKFSWDVTVCIYIMVLAYM